MNNHTRDSLMSDSMSNKTNSKLQIKKKGKKIKFLNFAKNFTSETPSEVAW